MTDSVSTGATQLIQSQLGLVAQLQHRANEAITRNDWQNVDKIITQIDVAFNTFLEGVKTMAIDVSSLKNVLTTGAASADDIKQLKEKIESQAKDIEDIKTAFQELNSAASSAPTTPTVP